ncbi:MAG: hypothetical protein JWP91_3331 [Fibrobacteres bacterium]|nr:hypothetical protein [Fibrobacterota bacterium]
MKYNLLGFVLVLFGSEIAHATPHWSGPVTISDIYVWDYAGSGNQNYVNVRSTPFYNPENCGDTQGYQLTTTADSKYFDRIYAFLLSAYTTGQTVSLLIDGCNTKPVIKAVSFKQPQN